MKTQEFSTRVKNFKVVGLFEVNETTDMMRMSIEENWNLSKEDNPIFEAIIQSYLQLKTGMPFGFDINCCVMKEDDDNLFIKYEKSLFYLHVANIVASKDLSLNDAIEFSKS